MATEVIHYHRVTRKLSFGKHIAHEASKQKCKKFLIRNKPDYSTPILGPGLRRCPQHCRTFLSKRLCFYSAPVNALPHQLPPDRLGTFFPKCEIIVTCSTLVTMPFNKNALVWIGFQIFRNKQQPANGWCPQNSTVNIKITQMTIYLIGFINW